MKQLTYTALEAKNSGDYLLRQAPERVLQFGEGNFLRGFADYFVDIMNERADFNTKVVVVPPVTAGKAARINRQEGLYTLCLQGRLNGAQVDERRVISCISRALDPFADYGAVLETAHNPDMCFILSNTTEAGIVYDPACRFDDRPPASFPAKLTRLLYERFTAFDRARGYTILPCELITDNGAALRDCVERYAGAWSLGADFLRWLRQENRFYNTLVDRIVPGYSPVRAEEMVRQTGLSDALLAVAEPFALWVVEAPPELETQFPAGRAGLPVHFVEDYRPYKERKVRILNGAHTVLTPVAFLAGQDLVRLCMEAGTLRVFLEGALFDEILPTLDLPGCVEFAQAVLERFSNPYLDHRLLDIALNCVSKWRARVLPSLVDYAARFGRPPRRLTFSFAALMAFYTQGVRDGVSYAVRDDPAVHAFFAAQGAGEAEALSQEFAGSTVFWGRDLREIPGFAAEAARALVRIRTVGMAAALEELERGVAL